MELSTKRIRELIACPQFGDDHYGEWGCLAYDQRKAILHLVETIDRQQAEVERLDKLVIEKHKEINRLDKYIQYTKNEAYKEFAARVNEKLQNLARMHMQHGSDEIYFLVSESFIDNVLKELTEEKK